MRVDFDSPIPEGVGRPLDVAVGVSDDDATFGGHRILVGFVLVLLLWIGILLSMGSADPAAPVRGPFPFSERDSIVACGRGPGAISQCLASEDGLRSRALALWNERSAEVQRFCMGSISLSQPVGRLYTCLVANGDASDLRR